MKTQQSRKRLGLRQKSGDLPSTSTDDELFDREGDISAIYTGINYALWDDFPPHVHGLIWHGCHKNLWQNSWLADDERNEAEISLPPSGATHFERSVTSVTINGEETMIAEFKANLEKFRLKAA